MRDIFDKDDPVLIFLEHILDIGFYGDCVIHRFVTHKHGRKGLMFVEYLYEGIREDMNAFPVFKPSEIEKVFPPVKMVVVYLGIGDISL
jgi:hypothetical protein